MKRNPFDSFERKLAADTPAKEGRTFAGAYVSAETHAALRDLARRENRTVAGQCREIYRRALEGATPARKEATP